MLQNAGLGKLKPNILVIGYKDDWITSSYESVEEYSDVIHDAFDFNYGVAIFRLPKGTHLDEDDSEGSAGECSDFEDTDGEFQGAEESKKPKEKSVKIEVELDNDDSMIPASTPMIQRDSKQRNDEKVAESPATAKRASSEKRPKEQVMLPLTDKRKGKFAIVYVCLSIEYENRSNTYELASIEC